MGARKVEKFPIREMSLRAVKVDHGLQSRVVTSIENQREFSEAMLRGDVFPPVVIFFDGKTYRLADGFHRFGAVKATGAKSIRAEVRVGSRRDAMVFSAGANIKFSIPRTKDDIRKAVFMVLSDPEWFGKVDSAIAKHCGTGRRTVTRYRVDFCKEHGIPFPKKVYFADGRHIAYQGGRKSKSGNPRGSNISLGNYDGVRDYLTGSGVSFSSPVDKFSGQGLPGVRGCLVGDALVTWTDLLRTDSFTTAVGSLLLLNQIAGPDSQRRLVVLCYEPGHFSGVIAVAEKLGIEAMTPIAFVDSLKCDIEQES